MASRGNDKGLDDWLDNQDVGLVTLTDYPLVSIDVHNVVRCQVLHVDEREGGEAHEYKNVTNEGQIVILELMGYEESCRCSVPSARHPSATCSVAR